ncbi:MULTISPECIES: DUF3422 family protein [unclassified Shinella]|jgi:uncharacterized membrane-anchored protein|uniref:DUF3422 family protein n=1 Tax=unclassified Shinella TaxID=2643062 RepID=UPI00234F46C7|nr:MULTISPECIES: DUF3422 family protein [unclassified Shinella]MCO5154637.1 DUF3422 family protein [Shinella sp.]MDC7261028.1 DUF3422 family protein [Shinella sp. HY16]MDC7267923.1 DUF3422 family protein [Shinella sp. YZ44]
MAKGSFAFPQATARAQALGEIHARPYALVPSPRVIFQLAFLTEGGSAVDHAVMGELSRSRGISPPGRDSSHHALSWGQGTLRWERHTEFSTYFWDAPAPDKFGGEVPVHPFGDSFSPPGTLISGVRLEIRPDTPETREAISTFDPTSLCYSEIKNGQGAVLTDFRQNGDGLTQILVIDRGMTEAGRGALVQRLLDIETYRTLAMMGLPLAQSLSPDIRRIEDGLTGITNSMKQHARDKADTLLTEITRLAAELEANAALSLYRFGASRAYYGIVQERIRTLAETAVSGYETLGFFLERRLAPAMRTCQSVEERQANLSRKLARATALLRSWIDVELEQLNTGLLNSMDRRAKLQLRLQQTVEGLSVAAISYYVVGLFGYVAKAAHGLGLPVKPETLTGIAVPFVIVGMWLLVRAIRQRHAEEDRH